MAKSPATEQSLVSVIIPTFNRPALTVEAIESVRQQEYQSWELWVVDDGSTDDTQQVMSALPPDGRIHFLRQENKGQAVARNLGLNSARGDWIAFLDSDDRWLPDKLCRQVAYLTEHPDVDILYGEPQRIDGNGHPLPGLPSMRRHSGRVWRELLNDNFVPFSTSIVRTQLIRSIGGFDENFKRADDYDLWLRLSVRGIFHFLPSVVSQYRVAGERISDNVHGRYESNKVAVERFISENPDLLSRSEADRIRGGMRGRFARSFADRRMFFRSLHYAFDGLRYAPTDVTAWRTLLAVTAHPVRERIRRLQNGRKVKAPGA